MNKDDTKEFLKMLGAIVPGVQPRAGWVVSSCPLAYWRHESKTSSGSVFGVRTEPGDARVNCFACGFNGTQMDILVEMGHRMKTAPYGEPDIKKAMEMVIKADEETELSGFDSPDIEEVLFGAAKKEMTEFPEWWITSYPPAWEVEMSLEYLKKRRVPLSVTKALGLRVDTDQKRVCFPVRDFHGKYRGLHGRAILDETMPRYRMYTYQKKNNPLIWLGEDWIDMNKPVVVVEGPLDLASVYRVYRNVVSPLFASPSYEKIKRMADAFEMITLFDHGTGGNLGRQRFTGALPHNVLTHLMPTDGKKDPGEMTVEELALLLEKHVMLDDFLLD